MHLNSLGTPATVTDLNGRQISYDYDPAGRPVRATFADGSFAGQQFDALGRRAGVTNEEGQVTTFSYDGLGRLTAVAGLTGTATYGWDEAGNLLARTDALGRVTRFRYDLLNRLVERRYPGGEVERVAYDAVGNATAITDANSNTIALSYDAMNRVTRKDLPDGSAVTYTYAADDQRASTTGPLGTTTYGYDARGRLAAVTHPTGEVVSYTRDANGNLLSITSPSATLTYAYDALNRLVQVTAPEGQTRYFYDLAGNRVRIAGANGLLTDYAYDLRNRPTQLIHQTAGGTALQSFANVFSPSGRRTHVTELDGSTESYTYDAQGRLTAEQRTGANPFDIAHAYDAAGNRTQVVVDGAATNFTYDQNDRLLSDGAATYGYDANGNLTARTAGASVTRYAYDAENRLTRVTDATGTTQFAYDADGNRVQSSTPAGSARFLVDTENNTGLSQVLEERDGSGSLLARYTYGDDLRAMVRGSAPRFYHRDAHGSTRLLTDAGGVATDAYLYDAYGRTVAAAGSSVNPYLYAGERFDSGLGLYHLRARYYNPALGRFMSRDPSGGRLSSPVSLHRYLYANADPVNGIDPTGAETLAEETVAQSINNTVDAAELAEKGNKICDAKGVIEAINQTVFFTQAALAVLALPLGLLPSGEPPRIFGNTFKKAKSSYTTEYVLLDEKRNDAPSGAVEKLKVVYTVGSGKQGIKMAISREGDPVGLEGSVTWPPLKAVGLLTLKEDVELDTITKCGIPLAELKLSSSFKLGGGGDFSGGPTGGISIAFKFVLEFLKGAGGFLKIEIPFFALEGDVLQQKFKTSLGPLELSQ
jgi:RHS repeat-associated protein